MPQRQKRRKHCLQRVSQIPERRKYCLQRMPQLPEKKSPVQKAQPGMPPRARKSQPKSLQYRPKSAQHLPEEPMSPKSTQCHPKKVTQCPRNLRRLLQVESADPSGVGCGRGLQRPTYTNAERQPQGTVVHLWSGKRDSDPRPQPWQGCALPTELFPRKKLAIIHKYFLLSSIFL